MCLEEKLITDYCTEFRCLLIILILDMIFLYITFRQVSESLFIVLVIFELD